jgi:hypothetical protein
MTAGRLSGFTPLAKDLRRRLYGRRGRRADAEPYSPVGVALSQATSMAALALSMSR